MFDVLAIFVTAARRDEKDNTPPESSHMLTIAAICLVITALLAYLNYRFIKMPSRIGVMGAALVFSLALVGLDALGVAHALREFEASLLRSIDFSDVPMQGMLSLLLFAGALHIDLSELKAYHWQVGRLAVLGTLLSTLVLGSGKWWALPLVGLPLPLVYCLLFGALISPTDPIAVMGILKSAGAPKALELVIASESLFNIRPKITTKNVAYYAYFTGARSLKCL